MDGIYDFIRVCGGESVLIDKTTDDMCKSFIVPLTAPTVVSYCDYLTAENSQCEFIGQATIFISHAWKYKFLDVIDAISTYINENQYNSASSFIWFDLFTNNQNGKVTASLPFEWWSGTFLNAIKIIGRVVMVLAPWENPVPLTRAWCLWEVYCSVVTKCDFDIARSKNESEKFEKDMLHDISVFYDMLQNIDVRKSQAQSQLDKQRIFDYVITVDGGFVTVNEMVINCICNWMNEYLEKRRNELQLQGNIELSKEYFLVSARLFRLQGKFQQSFSLCKNYEIDMSDVLHSATCLYEAALTISEMNNSDTSGSDGLIGGSMITTKYFMSFFNMDDTVTIKPKLLLERALELRSSALGPDHPLTIEIITELAKLNFDHEYLKNKMDAALKELGPDALESLRAVGDCVQSLLTGNFVLKKVLNTETVAWRNKAENLDLFERRTAIIPIAEDALQRMLSHPRYGEKHPASLSFMSNVGTLYLKTDPGNKIYINRAVELLELCVQLRGEKHGSNSALTVTSTFDLAVAYYRAGIYAKAESLLLTCKKHADSKYEQLKVVDLLGSVHCYNMKVPCCLLRIAEKTVCIPTEMTISSNLRNQEGLIVFFGDSVVGQCFRETYVRSFAYATIPGGLFTILVEALPLMLCSTLIGSHRLLPTLCTPYCTQSTVDRTRYVTNMLACIPGCAIQCGTCTAVNCFWTSFGCSFGLSYCCVIRPCWHCLVQNSGKTRPDVENSNA